MSFRGPQPDTPGVGADAEVEADHAQVLDLDTRLGLSTFGSERPDAPTPATPAHSVTTPAPPLPIPEKYQPTASNAVRHVESTRLTASPTQPSSAPSVTIATPAIRTGRARWWLVPAVAVLAFAAIVSAALWMQRGRPSSTPTTGNLTIDSTPVGARVIISGKDQGRTPLALVLAPGTYEIDLRVGEERHVVTVGVKAGSTTAQHVFLRENTAPANNGTLRITSEPGSAAVAVDGRRRGTTPLLLTDVRPGAHEVVVTGTTGTVRQRVRVEPKTTTAVMVPLPRIAKPQNTAGWVSITSPTELQVFEGDRLLGSTRVNRLMLPTGPHRLRLMNQAAGVDLTRQVTIKHGRTARVQITLPPGTLSVNAMPWATVSVDGGVLGETPLGGVELSPGPHEIVFTHPELGSRKQQITIRPGRATRVSVDMRR